MKTSTASIAGGKKAMMTELNPSHKGSCESRKSLGDIHISQEDYMSPVFSSDSINCCTHDIIFKMQRSTK